MTKPQKPKSRPEIKYRPSSLPMLALCPKFTGSNTEYTDEGTKRHNVFAEYFRGNKKAIEEYRDDTYDNLMWAIEYTELKAPMKDHPVIVETLLEAVLENGLPIWGTPDLICGPQIIDLKWRPRDYRPQMAAYAYMHLENSDHREVETTCLFASMQTHRTYKWTQESAWTTIREIIENTESAWAAPTPCEYCGWCANNRTCPALVQQVNVALAANPDWNLPQWHSSEMNTAKELGLALTIAKTLKDWCESVEFHAKEKATKEGVIAEGFKLMERQGNRVIDDVQLAFSRANLPQDEFIKACTVKTKALFETYAAFHGMKKAPAEREIEQRLGDAITRRSPSVMLVKEKPTTKKTKE